MEGQFEEEWDGKSGSSLFPTSRGRVTATKSPNLLLSLLSFSTPMTGVSDSFVRCFVQRVCRNSDHATSACLFDLSNLGLKVGFCHSTLCRSPDSAA